MSNSIDFNDDLEVSQSNNNSNVNALLPLDDDRLIEIDENLEEKTQDTVEDADPALIVTKHNFVTSPWTKLSIVGGFFALGFGVMFLSLNNLMGGGGQTTAKLEVAPEPTPIPFAEEKDGEVYAKLALQKQQSDLKNLNGKEENTAENDQLNETKPNAESTQKQTKSLPQRTISRTPPQRRTVLRTSEPSPQRTISRTPPSPPQRTINQRSNITNLAPQRTSTPRTIAATIPKISLPSNSPKGNNKNVDPLADMERLRNLSSFGKIEYGKNESNSTIISSSIIQDEGVSPETLDARRRRNDSDDDSLSNDTEQSFKTNIEDSNIQELIPRWEPATNKANKINEYEPERLSLINTEYLSEESQILEERTAQYLVVGSSTQATLVTPLMVAADKPNKNLQFLATLDEPILSNTRAIAIPALTQVVITVNGVDGGFGMDAEVVAILKNGTEYPITKGTISVLAKGGNPLIARPYKGKGRELAGYDMTLGGIAGLAKIGEVINRRDETTEDLPLGGTRTRTSGGSRNIGGAFLEGAFAALATRISGRTETATDEIINRPNVWYVPNNSTITLRINRSIKL